MSSQPALKDSTVALTGESISRKPQQGRSLASLERMLSATEKLMLERGSEDFTLQEVSQAGNVSIGSIYLRFDGKDNLVRTVIAQALERIAEDEDAMMVRVMSAADTLSEFVPRYVDAYAEILRGHAPILRLTMQRAAHDPLVSGPGKASAERWAAASTAAFLQFQDEIAGKDRKVKASSAYHVIFSALARELSLGATGESARAYDWTTLKLELGKMCLAYLKHSD